MTAAVVESGELARKTLPATASAAAIEPSPAVAPIRIALLGVGTVGRALLQRLGALAGSALTQRLQLVHVANSTQRFVPSPTAAWQSLPLVEGPGAATTALGTHGTRILIDATASEVVADQHAHWLAQGIHVVTACKLGQGTALARWRAIRAGCERGGAHYGGEVKCERSGVCTSRGYGVLTSTNGWAYEGLWNTKQMELGCEAENGVYRFCGQEGIDPAFGMFTREDGLVTYCLTSVKADTIQGVFDFSAVLSDKIKVIRGGALNGYVEGPGVVEGKDGALYRGAFALSIRKGPALAVSGAGARIAARYERGVPVSGQVIYPDGSRYQGEFAGGDGTVALPHGLGALFAADGRILRQGRWAGGELVESFAPSRASAEASNPD